MVDSSTSVGPSNIQKVHDFIKQYVKLTNVAPNGVHVGLMQYSSFPLVDIPLETYTTRPSLMHAINQVNYTGGSNNVVDALKFTREQMFFRRSDIRKSVPKIAVVITDGSTTDPSRTAKAADDLRRAGIGVLAVAVGPGANRAELGKITGDPANVLSVASYDQLRPVLNNLMQAVCRGKQQETAHAHAHTHILIDT